MFKKSSITDVIAENLKNIISRGYQDYWSNPYSVARELVQIYNGEPLKRRHINALWRQTGHQDFATRIFLCPDYKTIGFYYTQIIGNIDSAIERAKIFGYEPTFPLIEWYFNNEDLCNQQSKTQIMLKQA